MGPTWEPEEHLAHCPERVAEYEAAAPRRPKARRAAAAKSPGSVDPGPGGPPPAPAEAPAPVAPAGWAVGPAGAPALGASVLYWWPAYGWQRGVVARRPLPPRALLPRRPLSPPHGGLCGQRRHAPRRPLLWHPLGVDRPLGRAPDRVSMLPSEFSRPAGGLVRSAGTGRAARGIDVSFITCEETSMFCNLLRLVIKP